MKKIDKFNISGLNNIVHAAKAMQRQFNIVDGVYEYFAQNRRIFDSVRFGMPNLRHRLQQIFPLSILKN